MLLLDVWGERVLLGEKVRYLCIGGKRTIEGKSSLPMYGRKAYYRGKKFVTYVWEESVLSGEEISYLCMGGKRTIGGKSLLPMYCPQL